MAGSSRMIRSRFSPALVSLVCGLLSPFVLTQCKTTSGTYKDVSYDPTKLKTPTGHGMEKKDYPFDENGAYRKDWVKNNASGRDSSASQSADASTQTSATAPAEGGGGGSTSYPTYAEASAARSSGNFVGPSGEPAPGSAAPVESIVTTTSPVSAPSSPAPSSEPSYHKVKSGDTLFSLSSRYSTSVAELKRLNGLKSDSIRVGQSLRIP